MTEPPESAGAGGGSGDGVPDLDLTSERDGSARDGAMPETPGGDGAATVDA